MADHTPLWGIAHPPLAMPAIETTYDDGGMAGGRTSERET